MKAFSALLSILILLHLSSITLQARDNHGVYYQELELFKKSPETRIMFNKDANPLLAEIQRDLIVYKNLTSFQRIVRVIFLALDGVVVTRETMPSIYSYVESVCENTSIAMPTVFITYTDGFFNAFAQKLLTSSGGIIIGQKLIDELSDESIEAVVAHEIGHVKYNHSNKSLALSALKWTIWAALLKPLGIKLGIEESDAFGQRAVKVFVYGAKAGVLMRVLSYLPRLIINKRFEKEADEFAYKVNGKGVGLVKFCECILEKEQLQEEDFISIYELIQKNKDTLVDDDYRSLMISYYIAYAVHLCNNRYKKIYHETFVGAHPSPQARIAAVQKYMIEQENR